jgi:dihydroorotate dehydrogenase (fumarate)
VCDQAGASAIEINVSCPHGPYTLGEGDFLSAAADILALGRSVTSLPLIPKLTPQLTDPIQAARVLAQAGGSAVVMFNRFTGLDIDLDTLRPVMHGGYAGHGGPWALHYVLRWIAAAYPQLDLPIAASGGVSRGSDVAKAILAGATVVQSCTAIVLEGYPVITRLIQGLEEFMERHGFSTLADFRGVVCDRVLTAEEVDRTASRRATIDETRCTACGRCRQACIYEAVAGDEKYTVLPDRCSGCGLCVEICPVNCMALVPRASR